MLAFYVFIAHCLTAQGPFLNLRLLADRNYAIGLVLVTIYGMLNFTPDGAAAAAPAAARRLSPTRWWAR